MSGMYWYAVAASDNVAGLKDKGFCVTSDGEILYNEQYEYELARMYTNDGHGIVDVDTSNFFFDKDASDRITINAEDPMTTPVLSYKLRITDQYPDAEWFYFAANKSEEILEDGVPHPLYKADGTLATKTDYADCEFEALNPMPSEFFGMYGRFTTATFSFATYQSTADVLHVEFTGLHQEEEEYCFADRLRVVVTASPAPAAYDTATGTISEITLPSAHSYTDVTFDSLRYYVKGTLSNTGYASMSGYSFYYGTVTWTDSSLGDLSSKIRIADLSDPNWLSTLQDVFKIIFINEGISGYSPDFTGYTGGGQITAYSYNNGVHSITAYLRSDWTNTTDSGRIHFRYLDDTTTFNNLSAFDLVTISNGVLSKDTTTDRYAMYNAWNGSVTVNAKYTASPAPTLPTVSTTWLVITPGNGNVNIPTNADHVGYWWDDDSQSYVSAVWNSNVTYGMIAFYTTPFAYAGRMELEIKEVSGTVGVHNVSSSTVTVCQANIAVCSSPDATVITVYDSSNNPYNAFKYTSDGTDYYYVLDGTQTDWTDDLSSIGYHVPPALPTVEMINSRIGTIDSVGTISSWSNGDSAYQWRSIGGVYSLYTTENTSYIVCCGRIDNTTASNAVFHGFDAEFDLQGYIKITNNTGSTYSNAYSSLSYVCKNSSVTVITVYDSSNNPYNAFKYTSDGTDYYYVLDGTQTDWTDDLASIGYHVPPAVLTAWFTEH